MMTEAKPFGHTADVRRRIPWSADANGLNWREEVIVIRRQGSRRRVERAAGLVSGFIAIERIEAFSEVQWRRVFGHDRRT